MLVCCSLQFNGLFYLRELVYSLTFIVVLVSVLMYRSVSDGKLTGNICFNYVDQLPRNYVYSGAEQLTYCYH